MEQNLVVSCGPNRQINAWVVVTVFVTAFLFKKIKNIYIGIDIDIKYINDTNVFYK